MSFIAASPLPLRAFGLARATYVCCSHPGACSATSRQRTTVALTDSFSPAHRSKSTASAGPSRSRSPSWEVNDRVHDRSKKHSSTRRKRKAPLLRLDSRQPLIPTLTPATPKEGGQEDLNLRQRRAQRLSQLHTALQSGSADAVWSAYLDLQQTTSGRRSLSSTNETEPHSVLTAAECKAVAGIVNGETSRTRSGLNRILRLSSDVRGQQRRILTSLQHAHDIKDDSRIRLLNSELEEWDSVISPVLLTQIISQIGTSLRTVGLEELDQVLDQLLTYEANEQSRRNVMDHKGGSPRPSPPTYPANALHDLRTAMLSPVVQSALRKRPSKQPDSDFPDLATYNTILHIITGTVQRSKVTAVASSKHEQMFDEDEDDDSVSKFAEEQLDSQAAQLEASLTSKLRRFHLDADAVPSHLDAFERADRLFHTVLDRMQRRSRIEPDAITFNIMITMYCLLDRWSEVHRVVRSANDKGALNIDCINNVLSHWLARGPTSKSKQRNSHDGPADAADSALEVYRQLRQNLVRLELASQDATIAYGRRQKGRNEHSTGPQDQLGPLAWPDRNEAAPSSRSDTSADLDVNGAVRVVLGLSSLPAHVAPDEITHALMINSLTREGRFADALSVFRDLVSTPRRQATAGPKADRTHPRKHSLDKQEKNMQATVPMFISFFRGFARYGRPSVAVDFDPDSPGRTSWGPVLSPDAVALDEGKTEEVPQPLQKIEKHAQQLELWTVDTFQEIFDAFLGLEPDVDRVVPATQKARVMDAKRELLDRRVSTPFGWLTLAETSRLNAIRRAPGPKELFWILTAIRRVSNDHAEWSLAMWQKVVDKFSSERRSSSSQFGWTGFRLDSRLQRVLEHLQGRSSQDELADKLQEK